MMDAGDERIVADRLHALLSKPPAQPAPAPPAAPAADLAGQWNVSIQFAAATARAHAAADAAGNELDGAHQGEFVSREIFRHHRRRRRSGIRSAYGEQHGDALST